MGLKLEAKCKLCKREDEKLFLKGTRCYGPKCALEKKQGAAKRGGVRTTRRRQQKSEYGSQLREKQKLKRLYGMMETQFRRYYEMAEGTPGITGDNLLVLLERRLDNVAFRLGFAMSRGMARQLVNHGHVTVNGKKVDVPSYLLRAGDFVALRQKSMALAVVKEGQSALESRGVPEWLELDKGRLEGRVKTLPVAGQIQVPVKVQKVVGLYTR
jgi:small subunit ribosomal protein S4